MWQSVKVEGKWYHVAYNGAETSFGSRCSYCRAHRPTIQASRLVIVLVTANKTRKTAQNSHIVFFPVMFPRYNFTGNVFRENKSKNDNRLTCRPCNMTEWYFLLHDKLPTRSGFGLFVSHRRIKFMLSLLDDFPLFSNLR